MLHFHYNLDLVCMVTWWEILPVMSNGKLGCARFPLSFDLVHVLIVTGTVRKVARQQSDFFW